MLPKAYTQVHILEPDGIEWLAGSSFEKLTELERKKVIKYMNNKDPAFIFRMGMIFTQKSPNPPKIFESHYSPPTPPSLDTFFQALTDLQDSVLKKRHKKSLSKPLQPLFSHPPLTHPLPRTPHLPLSDPNPAQKASVPTNRCDTEEKDFSEERKNIGEDGGEVKEERSKRDGKRRKGDVEGKKGGFSEICCYCSISLRARIKVVNFCKHVYCLGCLTEYLEATTKAKIDEPQCLGQDCKMIICRELKILKKRYNCEFNFILYYEMINILNWYKRAALVILWCDTCKKIYTRNEKNTSAAKKCGVCNQMYVQQESLIDIVPRIFNLRSYEKFRAKYQTFLNFGAKIGRHQDKVVERITSSDSSD
ncbi:unnamed protein product [Moneuplotes crassus]|uniref:RING-type domain-containing protein n=1 Tax=Euplotes crassus TaxID=5936 RepID=A0AAD1XED8_EUPCR|nr:unnamed protein product [Moneuplotes crassus]